MKNIIIIFLLCIFSITGLGCEDDTRIINTELITIMKDPGNSSRYIIVPNGYNILREWAIYITVKIDPNITTPLVNFSDNTIDYPVTLIFKSLEDAEKKMTALEMYIDGNENTMIKNQNKNSSCFISSLNM